MPLRLRHTLIFACALAALLPGAAAAGSDSSQLVWIVEESCDSSYTDSYHANDDAWAGGDELRDLLVGAPRVAGRFRSPAPARVTLLLRTAGGLEKVVTRVNRRGRFAVDLESMPEYLAFRWRDRDGTLKRSPWTGPLHSGCGEAPPPGGPPGWLPQYPNDCGDGGPPCPPPTWVPPRRPRTR